MKRLHALGCDVLGARTTLGPRGRSVVFGGGAKAWDNAEAYASGDVVFNDRRYFRALRDISPPFLPSLFDGEVPGKSDAWREISEAQAYAPSTTLFGMVDMNIVQRNMNALTPVTVEIARILLGTGQETIARAISGAKQPWYKSDLPGDTARKNVQAHLQWHASNLASIRGVDEQTNGYKAGDDLKKYVVQAFIEANAVETGAQWLSDAWDAMWTEIQTRLAAIPRALGQTAADVVKTAAGAAAGGIAAGFGMPTWLFWGGAAVVAGGLGYAVFKTKAWKIL